MKKLLTTLILLMPVLVFAQEDPFFVGSQQKSFLSISGGISAPLGQYTMHDINTYFDYTSNFQTNLTVPSSNEGFANIGFNIAADGVFYFSDNFGLSISLMYAQNPFNTKPFDDDFHNATANFPSVSGSFSASPYTHFAFMIGPVAGFSLSDELTVDFRVMAGILTTSFPTQDIVNRLNDTTATNPILIHDHLEGASSTTICFALGGFMRYRPKFAVHNSQNVAKKGKRKVKEIEGPKEYKSSPFSFFIKPELILASQAFQTSFYEYLGFNNSLRNEQSPVFDFTFNQPVNLFHFSIGIAYEFK